MLQVFLDSITRPEELSALFKYKFAPKSASAQRLKETLARDASKKRCYDFLNMASVEMHTAQKQPIHPSFSFFLSN